MSPEPPEATRKNLYVRPADRSIWTRAEQVAGDSLSAFVAEALRSYLRLNERERLSQFEAELQHARQIAAEADRRAMEAEMALEELIAAEREAKSREKETPELMARLARVRRDVEVAREEVIVSRTQLAGAHVRVEQLRGQVDERAREETDRLVVDLWDAAGYRHQKAFRGHWLLSPSDDFHRDCNKGRETIWSIAETLRGRYVVYAIDAESDHESGEAQGSLSVYESFDSLAAALPPSVREEIRTRTGRVEVEELDI